MQGGGSVAGTGETGADSREDPAATAQAMQRAVEQGATAEAIALGLRRLRALEADERAPVLVALALAYAADSQRPEALRTAAAARDLARTLGEPALEVQAVLATATALGGAEDHAGVIMQIERIEPLIDALGDPVLQAQALRRLGVSCSIVGEHDRAAAELDRAHALLVEAGEDAQAMALRHSVLNARVRRLDGLAEDDPARIAGHAAVLDEWLALAAAHEAAGNLRLALMSRGNFAICAWQCGALERGLAELDALLPRYAQAGMRPNVVITHNHRGHILQRLGRLEAAGAAYEAVLGDDAASPRERREALEGLAALHEARGDAGQALAALKAVRRLDRELDDARARQQAAQRELRLELARLNDHWSKLACEDALTGLPNRRALDAWLPAALARAAEGQPLAVLLIDADHFKAVNDHHGHATGDAVLRQLAQLLRAGCRYDDLPVRLGGEELLVALPHTGAAAALDTAERLRDAVARHPWSALVPGLAVTVSIGVAASDSVPPGALSAETLMSLADDRLYAAKRGGRNRVVG